MKQLQWNPINERRDGQKRCYRPPRRPRRSRTRTVALLASSSLSSSRPPSSPATLLKRRRRLPRDKNGGERSIHTRFRVRMTLLSGVAFLLPLLMAAMGLVANAMLVYSSSRLSEMSWARFCDRVRRPQESHHAEGGI